MNDMNLFLAPFINALFGAYYLVGNFGLAIILVTILIKLILLPLVIPSLKSASRIREIQPKLNKLKDTFGKDKQALSKAQMDLYKQEGINPMAGCLPQLLQIVVLILFFYGFNMVVGYTTSKRYLTDCKANLVDNKCILSDCQKDSEKKCIITTVDGYSTKFKEGFDNVNVNLIPAFKIKEDFNMNVGFLGSDLTQTPSKLYSKEGFGVGLILPIIILLGSGILQYISAKLMMPVPKVTESIVKETKDKEDDMMAAMRTQSTYMMPLMTIFFGLNFSLGMLLYWFITSALMIGQQLIFNKINKK